MRHWTSLAPCLAAAAALTACATVDPYTGETVRSNTRTGALVGAGAGALLGYLTNTNKSEEGRTNALIGAGVGALAGAGVGTYMDRQQAELRRELANTDVRIRRDGDNIYLEMPGDVTFDVDRAEIKPQFVPVLDDVARVLNQYPSTLVDVIGHADATGPDDYNLDLSRRRASSVADFLVNRGRVLPDRLYVDGQGERSPIASNETEAGRAQNRRVEVVLRPFRG